MMKLNRRPQTAAKVLCLFLVVIGLGFQWRTLSLLHRTDAIYAELRSSLKDLLASDTRLKAASDKLLHTNDELEYENHVMRDLLLAQGIRVHFGPKPRPQDKNGGL